jgi:hypothetical protein
MSERFLTRRVFARRFATGCIAAGPLASAAKEVLSEPAPATPSTKAPEDAVAVSKAIDAKEVEPEDLILELVKREYPKNLNEQHLTHIRREIEQQQARSRVLSAFPLTNADEPAPVFRAYRKD